MTGGFHALNSCPLFNSGRTQKIIRLSSREAELRAIVSSASDGVYVRSVLEFALGFVEQQEPDTRTIIACDVLSELNAGNFFARRRLEDMRSTSGRYHGHSVMLQAEDSSQEIENA